MSIADRFDISRDVVRVRKAQISPTLFGSRQHGLKTDGNAALLSIDGAARFLVTAGREIIVDAAEGCSLRNVRLFLLGSALGILCHQRGLLLLHANAVAIDGRAIAVAGPPGAGKSTLAGYFQRAGYPVLCDDVCGIGFDGDGRPIAWPGIPRLKLWGEAAAELGFDAASLDCAIDGIDKYHVPIAGAPSGKAIPFDRLYVLERAARGEESRIDRLRGAEAMNAVSSNTYRGGYLAAMGLTARHFAQCADLLRTAKVYRATRQWGFDVFEREAGKLERHARTGMIDLAEKEA